MKNIIKNQINSVSHDNLGKHPIVGIIVNGSKGWLQSCGLDSNKYQAFCNDSGVTIGNGWYCGNKLTATMDEWMDWTFSDVCPSQAFLFEDAQELFKWLIKEI